VGTDNLSAELVQSLQQSEAYPWGPATVELVETHISWVFLAGDRVIKVKRPVQYGFVDYSTLERRRHSCEEEVRLNRRLTDGVYLGTVPITLGPDGFIVAGTGRAVEWATLMRRLPADHMLDALIASDQVPANVVDKLAGRLVPFHREVAAACAGAADGSAAELVGVVTDNLDELRQFAASPLAPLHLALVDEAMRSFVVEQRVLLDHRVGDGWVRDGHGDLRAEHICFESGGDVQVFDCVEFNPGIRCADVASDLAFLLMDLERLGAGKVAGALVGSYRAAGVGLPEPLLRFYRAHRALVRAKIDCLSMSGGLQPHPGLAREASEYLELASSAALSIRPFLAAMTGLSGTGKSTVAVSAARATGAQLLSSDIVRKELASISGPAVAEWGEGIYASDWTMRTYDRLLELAASALKDGRPVILDASFLDNEWRRRAASVARDAGVPFLLIETTSDEAVAAARIAARSAAGDSPSDANLAIYRRQRSLIAAAPPEIPEGATSIRIDTTTSGAVDLDPLLTALRRTDRLRPTVPME
jgi:aminoglycoside phosphotransferase family enzyme/predicted kinase